MRKILIRNRNINSLLGIIFTDFIKKVSLKKTVQEARNVFSESNLIQWNVNKPPTTTWLHQTGTGVVNQVKHLK
jgi:hypothetical protein